MPVYGVPADLDLRPFVGKALAQVCLGAHEVQFRFDPEVIAIEGKWELYDAAGAIVDHALPHEEREAFRAGRLVGIAVVDTEVCPPAWFALTFADGSALRVYDDSAEHESFSIQPGDVFV